MNPKELRGLYEAYSEVYAPQENEEYVGEGKRAQTYGQPEMSMDYDERNLRNRGDLSKRDAGSIARSRLKGQLSAVGRLRGTSPHVDGRRVNNEEVDIYDIVLSHLLDEGYADTIESAEAIMVNMSEEWRDEIIDEAYVDYRKGKLPSGRTPQQAAQGRRDLLNARSNVERMRSTTRADISGAASRQRRRENQSDRTKEMDSQTGLAARADKKLFGSKVLGKEPNTDRHYNAARKRKAVSDLAAAEKKSRG